MSHPNQDDLRGASVQELFRAEVETQAAALTQGLLEWERNPSNPRGLEALMRAAHSLKGAARIVNLAPAVRIAHAMEDCFDAAQSGRLSLGHGEIDLLLQGVDLLLRLSNPPAAASPSSDGPGDVAVDEPGGLSIEAQEFVDGLAGVLAGCGAGSLTNDRADPGFAAAATGAVSRPTRLPPPAPAEIHPAPERVLRLTAENLNRLLGLAGESLVESRWLRPFSDSLQRLQRSHAELERSLVALRGAPGGPSAGAGAANALAEIRERLAECRQFLAEKLDELDLFDRRSAHLSHRLYLEVLRARMRPFGDGARRFPRMVRDLARALGKQVRLEIVGHATQVDRDILERIEAPLAHLLRNAVDHGCEPPAERLRAGKPAECLVQLEARHSAGALLVTVSDDGAGINFARLREEILRRKLAPPQAVEQLRHEELVEFLFLSGFTLKDTVTEISGRGVGLDVVQNMVKAVRGAVRVNTVAGRGTRFQLQLPLTLSVLRALLVRIGGEPYAVPLSQISRIVKLPRAAVQSLEGRPCFSAGHQQIGLVSARQVLDCGEVQPLNDEWSVVVLGDRHARYGLVVDSFLGQRELVVQPLDPRLGKVRDINAAALMEDGSPVLIIDVEDMLDSIGRLLAGGAPVQLADETDRASARQPKRILAVDDSLTVRELERKLLAGRGYLTDVAVDGLDGWNAVRSGRYDLVITDVDMPRMDGIELAGLIKRDPRFKSVPVLIVSYKERAEDRLRGLEAGADCYLTKGGFQDEMLLKAVRDLIGEPE